MSIFHNLHVLFLARLSSFSKSIILSALSQLGHGRLTVILKDADNENEDAKSETLVFGAGKPEAEIVVRSKNVWTRLCVNFDLVRNLPLLVSSPSLKSPATVPRMKIHV
jgi:hypothetical protein